MGKSTNWALVILIIGALIQILVGWNAHILGMIIIAAGIIIGILTMFKVTIDGINTNHKGHIIVATLILGILVLFGVTAGITQWTPANIPKTLDVNGINPESTVPPSGQTVYGQINFRPGDPNGTAFTGTVARVYMLDPSVAADRYTFMKYIANSNNGLLLAPGRQAVASPVAVSSNAFTWNGQNLKVGQHFSLAGYYDGTPASAENISFVKDAVVVSATGGSTPEIVWQFSDTASNQYTWRNYATTAWYSASDTAITTWQENQTSAIEKHVIVTVHPANLGEAIMDGFLWIEAPQANAGAIQDITITAPDGTSKVFNTFTALSNIAPGTPLALSQPSLTTATDTIYAVGSFGADAVRTGNNGKDKAVYTIDVRYNHPASGNVLMYLKDSFNTNALTSTGGHITGQTLTINMSASTPLGQSSS